MKLFKDWDLGDLAYAVQVLLLLGGALFFFALGMLAGAKIW